MMEQLKGENMKVSTLFQYAEGFTLDAFDDADAQHDHYGTAMNCYIGGFAQAEWVLKAQGAHEALAILSKWRES